VQQDDFLRPFNTRYTVTPRNRTDLGAAAGGPPLITIAQAREDIDPTTGDSPDDYIPDRLNQQVKIRGVVTSVDFRGASGLEIYIQDPTGGVDIFNTSINTAYNIGDNLEVTGTVAQFNGLTEINPGTVSNITVLPPGTLPTPGVQVVTVSQLGNAGAGEAFEGKFLRINNVTLVSPPATFAANTNYDITDGTGTVQMRIDGDTDIDGTAPPSGTFSVLGVLGQFDSTNPFDSGYQFFPRIRATDFLPATPAPASISATAGTPQTTNINTAFATQLQATVRDSGSAPIEGIGVTFTAPASGASGTFANSTTTTNATTDVNGVATASVFTANSIAGTYNVVASTASLNANFSLTNNNPAATHFDVTAPANVTNGVAFNVTVTARDAANNVAAGYTGTVHFTSTSAGTLPSDYTFVSGDNGTKTFSVTLTTNGSQSITATDTVTASITGTANTTVNAAPATHFSVTAPANVTNGVAFNVTVTALDASNATVTGYTGTVHFTSSSAGSLPSDYTFTGGDAGSHTFSVTLTTNGPQSITATDTVTASITGTANTTVNAAPQVATHFDVVAPANVTNGVAFNVTVTALDASNATVPGYTGTVHFTSTSAGTLPSDYTFTGGDAGSHTFSVTLTTNGPQSITATDTVTASITGTANTTVNAAPLVTTHFDVTAPATVNSGSSFNVTVTALDASNATVTTYTGTVHFTSSSAGTLPADYTFVGGDNGSHTFSVTLTTSGIQTITATDTVTPSINGTATVNVLCGGPPPPVAVISTAADVCANSTGNAASASPVTNYQWTITNGVITSGQGTSSITYTAGASGNVQLTATPITASGDCPVAQSGNATVAIHAPPTATLPSTVNACAGVNVIIDATLTGTAPFTVAWSDGLVQSGLPSNTAQRTFVTNSNTTLQVTSVTDAYCASSGPSNTANIVVVSAPVIDVQPGSVNISSGQTATLTVVTSSLGVSYQWYQGTPGDTSHPVGTNSSSFTTPPLTHTTQYWVRLTNACGSVDSHLAVVSVPSGRRRAANH